MLFVYSLVVVAANTTSEYFQWFVSSSHFAMPEELEHIYVERVSLFTYLCDWNSCFWASDESPLKSHCFSSFQHPGSWSPVIGLCRKLPNNLFLPSRTQTLLVFGFRVLGLLCFQSFNSLSQSNCTLHILQQIVSVVFLRASDGINWVPEGRPIFYFDGYCSLIL